MLVARLIVSPARLVHFRRESRHFDSWAGATERRRAFRCCNSTSGPNGGDVCNMARFHLLPMTSSSLSVIASSTRAVIKRNIYYQIGLCSPAVAMARANAEAQNGAENSALMNTCVNQIVYVCCPKSAAALCRVRGGIAQSACGARSAGAWRALACAAH